MNWLDGWLGFNTRTGEHKGSNTAAVACRSRRRNEEERWDPDLLGVLGNPWSLQVGRVEIDHNLGAPSEHIPMVKPEVVAEPTVVTTRNEEHGAKNMVSEFGATLGCKGCLLVGQPHTEECRARITARMESDPAHAKRLEDNLARRVAFAKLEMGLVESELTTNPSKRARQDGVAPQESEINGGTSSSVAVSDVEMQTIHAGKRPLHPGGMTTWCADLDVCDELDECNVHENDCQGDHADEVTGVTLVREYVAKARMEGMSWCDKLEVTDVTCMMRTGRKPISCRWRDIHNGDSE